VLQIRCIRVEVVGHLPHIKNYPSSTPTDSTLNLTRPLHPPRTFFSLFVLHEIEPLSNMPSIAEVSFLAHATSATPLVPVLKRKRTDEKDTESRPTSPVKRQKVAFNPEVNVHLLQDANEKPLPLIQEEVRRAIERHRSGDNIEYESLKGFLKLKTTSEDAPSNSLLRNYILVISGCVHAMGTNCGGLVDSLINCQWLRRDEQFLADFQRLLTVRKSPTRQIQHQISQKSPFLSS